MTDGHPRPRITQHSAESALLLGEAIYALYAESFRSSPHNGVETETQYLERWNQHRRRPGFLLLTLDLGTSTAPVGFLYGYSGRPGTWWFDHVVAELPETICTLWFTDPFEIVEMGVIPAYRGRGYGTRLIQRALEVIPNHRVVLSTQRDRNPVVRLYQREGFEVIHPGLRFSDTGEPFLVMARAVQR